MSTHIYRENRRASARVPATFAAIIVGADILALAWLLIRLVCR